MCTLTPFYLKYLKTDTRFFYEIGKMKMEIGKKFI